MFEPQTMFDLQNGISDMNPVTAICISTAWKSSVFLLLAGALALMLSRRSAALRHLVWTAAFGGTLAIPLMELILPAWQLPAAANVTSTVPSTTAADGTLVVPPNRIARPTDSCVAMLEVSALERTVVDEASAAGQAQVAEQRPSGISVANSRKRPTVWLLSVWLVGTIGMLVRLAAGIAALKRLEMHSVRPADEILMQQLADTARQLGLARRVRLLLSDDRAIPMTWGTIRPMLLLPREAQNWPADRLRIVLQHELVHVVRCDYLSQLVGALARAVYWFNPLAWWGYRQLKVELEHSCDDRVLALGTQAETYAFELLHITSQFPSPGYTPSAALAMGRSARIQRRIETILDSSRNRMPLTRRFVGTAAIAGLLFTAAIASMHDAKGQELQELREGQPAADAATISTNPKQATSQTEPKSSEPRSSTQQPGNDTATKRGIFVPSEAPPADRLSEIRKQILKGSVKSPNERALDEGAIRGMLQSLDDPHSEFLSGDKLKELEAAIEGTLIGIGVEVSTSEKQLVVITPVPDSPAEAAGLKAGDAILAVDGKTVAELGPAAAINAIRGKAGTIVVLQVKRAAGDEAQLDVTRGSIRMPSVKGLWRDLATRNWNFWLDQVQKLGYVQIADFGKQTVEDCQTAVKTLLQEGLKGLVLDLRHCPGGLLVSSVGVAELFLREGTIVSIKGEQAPETTWRANGNNFLGDFPLLVLIDEHTVSAAEILAGALKENGRATILGTRTFGKGSVQSILPVEGNGAIRLTTAYFYLAGGRSIDRQKGSETWGVDPTDGYYVPVSSAQQEQWLKTRRRWENTSEALRRPRQGNTAISEAIKGILADPQLAAAYQSMSARITSGAFLKVGLPAQALRENIARREQLLKARADAQKHLESIEKELSNTSGGTGGK